ncbi:SDR family oxidoreductase [Niabella drilacis]|uniref:NAD(P)-dependent dehydrogenase, short-chain alcohol dehydrogenase family n=1 Tax=Niabella drilacis (strain DSM 25811 / CCM 8410 / CCUG 62505 / LMG 26954 / E90) TaxID=1285928 RepID=A0A1G6S3Z7_NIADE|nr:SDR family oxidoreductase [Niabella drilacis]SDD11421.1 NAD(P)-dependent dehydrogenase, short-chain alcohol dehydrogenase family [Niabella drilacis]
MIQFFSLEGRVAVVTGGAGLYGKPISLALAQAGAQVIIASRNLMECKAYAAELREMGLKAAGLQLDLKDERSITGFVATVIRDFGKMDVLINNAVSREGFKNLDAMSKAEWEGAQAVNSTGLMLLTKEVLKDMCRRKAGNIINIGSIQGSVGPNFPVYGETGMTSPVNYTYDKWAMVGFTKWIANYYGRFNIRCNCLSPGGYGPGVSETFGETEFSVNYKQLTPLGRFANDEDIKGPVVFLASDASAFVTGHNLLVDGGWTSW